MWSRYVLDFRTFHDHASALISEHSRATTPFPQGFPPPSNLFDISSLPWTTFTSFTIHVENGWEHDAPVFTLGRYTTREGRLIMPFSLQIHHAAAGGFHASRLLGEPADLVVEPDWVN